MSFNGYKMFVLQLGLIVVLLGALLVAIPVQASSDALPQVKVSTPSYPVGMESGERKLVTYSITESGNVSGTITSRSYRFYTQYDEPLSDLRGPYPVNIKVNALATNEWDELVYLPQSVVEQARALKEYAIVLKTTFLGKSTSGTEFDTQASLLLLLPPDEFSKSTPAEGAVVQPVNQSLYWNGSVGAIDYEYCFDTIDNNSCDTNWTGTYDTNAALQNLSSSTTFYWQVRANNMAGSTYANNGNWWSFRTCVSGPITVINLSNSGAGSLRQAIIDICSGGTINFDPSLAGQMIILSSATLPAIDKTLTIDGGSGASITLNGASSFRIFEITPTGNLTLNNLTIHAGNYTSPCIPETPTSPPCGGGIYSDGALTITNSTFSQNSAQAGGAIFIARGTAEISNSTFVENPASYQGGAIVNWTGTVTISNSTFFKNSAIYGGAIYNDVGSLTSSNNTFSNNSATYGGGLYNAGILQLTNNILANSISGADCFNEDGAGEVSVDIGNLVEVNAAATNNCGTPAVTGDPSLGPLANNGGFTQTMVLLSGSPAIDAGEAAFCPATDQRGVSRPQGSACDIGAFEYVVIPTPTPTLTSTATSTPPPTLTPTPTLPPSHNSLYVSFTSSLTVGGIPSANEDILYFNGTSWSQFFDGSDVGLGNTDLSAFSFVDEDTILMSFTSAFTVDGIAVTPQDILRFDASSLGTNTAGIFNLYFDGSDVGLENTTSEKIDALALLPDGRLLISTNGDPSVTGLTTGKDEDVLAFTPTSLGDVTSGTWSLYFDGSDVGLSEASGEDVDALDVVGGSIYLSTRGDFSVSGVSGAKEDVFVCAALSIGDVTACDYSSSLYFDGSAWGLSATNVDGFHFAAAGPAPTNTPTSTFTLTATSSVTATATSAGNMFAFLPLADTYVNASSPASNYGSASTLRVDASPDVHSYLRFSVQGLNGTVTKATLRLYANSSSSLGCTVNSVADNTWNEAIINYNNAPPVGGALGSSGLFGANAWVSVDVTAYITGNGTYNLALTTPSSTAVSFASSEAAANAPQLIIETTP